MQEHKIPPRMLMESFAIVVGSYVAIMLGQLLSTAMIAWLAFPQVLARWTERPLSADEIAADIEALMPRGLFWSATGLTALIGLAVGALVARMSRFAPVGHAVFLAILTAVTYLQFAAEKPGSLKWMALTCMLAFPLAILWGCRLGLKGRADSKHAVRSAE